MRLGRIVSALLIVATGLLAADPPSSSAVARPASARRIYFFEYPALNAGARVRPSQIVFDADGNNAVTGLSWKGWGTKLATGTGTDHVDNCSPNCASGHISKLRVHVRLSDPGKYRRREIYRCYRVSPSPKGYMIQGCTG